MPFNPCGCLKEVSMSDLKTTFKSSSLILLYEMVGTAMMTSLVVNYYNERLEHNDADNCGLLLGMFVTIMFSARISGSHFNPCITLGFMFGDVKH